MSFEKGFQAKEIDIVQNYNIRPVSGRERPHRRYHEAYEKKPTIQIADFEPPAYNVEEEKDDFEENPQKYFNGTQGSNLQGLRTISKKNIDPKSLPESPFSNHNNFRTSFKTFGKTPDIEKDMGGHDEDSVDFTGFNNDFAKSTIYSPQKKSPRRKAAIPLMRPILETKENQIQRMIEEAEPNTLIHLPAMNISIPYLHLTKPITIKGVPGSEIKLTQGPIMIDLKNDKNKSGNKVVFCECTIHAEYSKQRLLDNMNTRSDSRRGGMTQKESEDSFKLIGRKVLSSTKSDFNTVRTRIPDGSLILFQVNSGSILEVRDCQIKSLIKENMQTSEETKMANEVQDTAFWLHHEEDYLDSPILMMSSTTISGFYTFVQSDPSCSTSISKCFLSNSRGHACNLDNPKAVKITENIFEKTAKSAINIKFSKENIDDKPHSITIKNNEINYSSSYGISIFGEHLKPLNVNILIDYNKISHSKKDSLGIKFLNIPDLKISHNNIIYSKGNGISLQNVFDTMNSSPIYLRKNNIQSCEGNGLIVKDCPILMEYDEITLNNKSGLFMVLEDYNKEGKDQSATLYQKIDFRVVLNNCKIYQNRESGINLAGSLKGPMLLNSCILAENLYGIYVTEKESASEASARLNMNNTKIASMNSSSPRSKDKRKAKEKALQRQATRNHCHFSIEKCEITRNNIAGIYLKKLISELYFIETYVNMNKEQALFMEDFNDKDQIKLKEQEKARISEYFHGYVGGYWGELYEGRPTSCKNNNCSIFCEIFRKEGKLINDSFLVHLVGNDTL